MDGRHTRTHIMEGARLDRERELKFNNHPKVRNADCVFSSFPPAVGSMVGGGGWGGGVGGVCGGVCGGGLGEAQTEAMELGVCFGRFVRFPQRF